MSGGPWRVRYRLKEPLPDGTKVRTTSFWDKGTALHEGQRLFDGGCPVVTLTNAELPAARRLVKHWERPAPTRRGRRR